MIQDKKIIWFCRLCLGNKYIVINVTATVICILTWIYKSAYMVHLERKEEKKQITILWLISAQTRVAKVL